MKKRMKSIVICSLMAAVLIKVGCAGQSGPPQSEISTNKAYVTSADGTMAVITHGDTPELLRTVTVGGSGDINAGLGHAYVNNSAGNSVTAIDGENDAVIGSIGVGTNPVHNLVINEEGIGLLVVGNDGPPDPGDVPDNDPENADDSISVIDINPNHGTFLLEIARIRVGDGHHKLAYSHETNRVAVSNLSDGTVSIVDLGTLSALCTVDVGIVPHGIDYSHESGHVYNANVADPADAITIIDLDAAFAIPADPYDTGECDSLIPTSTIAKGTGPGQIPASGYTHANHEGTYVFTAGYDAGTLTGYISSIETATDTVANVLVLPNFQPDKLVELEDRIYISSIEDEADPVNVPGTTVAVVDVDPATGVMSLHPTPAFSPLPEGFLPVGRGHDHRALFVSHHGDRLFVPNSGADPGTVTVFGIDTATDPDTFTVLDTFEVGEEPNALTVLDHETLEIPEDPTGGGHEH